MSTLAAPQLVINSRMIYSSWIPADPKAAAALLQAYPRTHVIVPPPTQIRPASSCDTCTRPVPCRG